MELFLTMVGMSIILSLVVPIAVGYIIGDDRDHPVLGTLIGVVVGALLAWGAGSFGMAMARKMVREELAKEASRETYASIAALKGRYCDVDAAIAAAMKDRVLSNGDARRILAVNEPHEMAQARANLSDTTISSTCRPQGTDRNQKR